MRRIKQIMGILLSWLLLIGVFQFMPINIDSFRVSAAAQSGDNSLSSLSISPGTLSPAFQYNIVDYTASVGADVTSVEVSAETSNETATIESVSGNTDLQAGENLISIVVKAENGTAATYKIVVTRQEGGETAAQEPAEDGQQTGEADGQQTGGADSQGITINGHPFNLASAIPDDVIPAGFTKTTVTCQGQQVEGLVFEKAELMLVYLTTPSTEVKNTLAVYEEASNSFCPFRKISFDEENYLIILDPPAESGLSQEYTQTMQTLGELADVPAYVKAQGSQTAGNAEEGEDGAADSQEFSLFYGVSSYGNKGWYQYDALESTFQRYMPVQAAAEPSVQEQQSGSDGEPSAEMQSLQKAYTDMEEQYNAQKDTSRKTTAVLVFIIAVLVVVIVNLLLRGRKEDEDELEDELEYDELTERVREQVKSVRKSRRGESGHGRPMGDEEDDLWEDDTVPKAILKQQTKVIPALGMKEQQNSQTRHEAKAERKQEKKDRRQEQRLERKAEPRAERRAEPKAERRPEPVIEPDEDFEVIDLEDL